MDDTCQPEQGTRLIGDSSRKLSFLDTFRTLFWLAFSRLCLLSGVGCLVGIVDHTSVLHGAVVAGKLWFLGKSRSNPLCMGEGLGCRFCLAWLNVDFRKLVGNGKLLGWMTLASHMGEYFGRTRWFRSNGGTKTDKKWKFPAGITY